MPPQKDLTIKPAPWPLVHSNDEKMVTGVNILLWIGVVLAGWATFGFIWLKLFVGDEEEEEHKECPYE